jgi:transposase
MILASYPTDLTDTQSAVLAPLIPAAKAGGSPRTNRHARGGECCLLRPAIIPTEELLSNGENFAELWDVWWEQTAIESKI